MRRREVLVAIGAAALTGPFVARAQQKAVPVVGFLSAAAPDLSTVMANIAAFHQGLGQTGYIENQNVLFEYRWAEGRYDRLPALAASLVDRKVDLIATTGGTGPALAAKNATATIPIVFVTGDPVTAGLVTSLSKPSGNLTGLSIIALELMPKRLELLSELVPGPVPIALLVNPNNPRTEQAIKKVRDAVGKNGRPFHVLAASTESEIDAAFEALIQLHAAGIIVVGPDPYFSIQRNQLVALATRHAIPAIYPQREFVTLGGLISYGPSFTVAYRQAGMYAGRILEGAKPADLPIQQPTSFELVVNLATAKAIGLVIPASILARADAVIE